MSNVKIDILFKYEEKLRKTTIKEFKPEETIVKGNSLGIELKEEVKPMKYKPNLSKPLYKSDRGKKNHPEEVLERW